MSCSWRSRGSRRVRRGSRRMKDWPQMVTEAPLDWWGCSQWWFDSDTSEIEADTWPQMQSVDDSQEGHDTHFSRRMNWCRILNRSKMSTPWFLRDNSWILRLTTGYLYSSITWWRNHGLSLVHHWPMGVRTLALAGRGRSARVTWGAAIHSINIIIFHLL